MMINRWSAFFIKTKKKLIESRKLNEHELTRECELINHTRHELLLSADHFQRITDQVQKGKISRGMQRHDIKNIIIVRKLLFLMIPYGH